MVPPPLSLPPEASLPGLESLNVHHKAVLVRADLNIGAPSVRDVGVEADLADDWRLEATLPCLKNLIEREARVVLLTHRGRPPGVPVPALSTHTLAPLLRKKLGVAVHTADDCIGTMVEDRIRTLPPGEVLLLENVRFHAGETTNDVQFVQQLRRLADLYVLEAYPSLHRGHASLSGLMAVMPQVAVGPRMQLELTWLQTLLNPQTPLTLLLGGVQIGLKLDLLHALMGRVDTMLIGGGAAHTLLAAREVPTGLIHFEPALMDSVRQLLAEAGVRGCRLLLPQDVLVASTDNPAVSTGAKHPGKLATHDMAMDIGPETLEKWTSLLSKREGNILWLGSLGAWEYPAFRTATQTMADTLAPLGPRVVVGGDGLLQALRLTHRRTVMPCVSTGAGVIMHALRGLPLPALHILTQRLASPTFIPAERRKS